MQLIKTTFREYKSEAEHRFSRMKPIKNCFILYLNPWSRYLTFQLATLEDLIPTQECHTMEHSGPGCQPQLHLNQLCPAVIQPTES